MPATRPRVPGWHPDPDDPSSLRHWDGQKWGGERRPRPSWAPPSSRTGGAGRSPTGPDDTGGDGPPVPEDRPGGGRRWWLLAAVALGIGLLVVSVPAWLDTAPDIPPRSVGDQAFTDAADAVCARTLPPLRRERPESREATGTPAEFARRIDRAADGLMGITTELRALPVAAVDAARVNGWLNDWEDYAGVGHRYADSLRAEDDDLSRQLEAQGSTVSTRIFVFARANGMPSCTF